MDINTIKKLKRLSVSVRRDCIETQIKAGSGHLGGAFSAVEIMTYLYFYKMNVNPGEPLMEGRDIFILSKGHASIGYYSVLARKGFFPVEELQTYRQINSRLQGHTHIDDAPGIECTTGSLGQGLSFGIGLALGYKKKKLEGKIYVMLGDGELEEGQIWEAVLLQAYLKLDNLIIVVDKNNIQLDDFTENIIGLNGLKDKFQAFGYDAVVIDGHNFESIDQGFNRRKGEKPLMIIANTIKGKGISFMENNIDWHAKKLSPEEYKMAMEELRLQEVTLDE